MGVPEKLPPQMDGVCPDTEGQKWVTAGSPLLAPLRPVYAKRLSAAAVVVPKRGLEEEDEGEYRSPPTTPTAKEARIPALLSCPPAPRKRKPSRKCRRSGFRAFFNPPDLESVFVLHARKTN